jgi:hypothetical protein
MSQSENADAACADAPETHRASPQHHDYAAKVGSGATVPGGPEHRREVSKLDFEVRNLDFTACGRLATLHREELRPVLPGSPAAHIKPDPSLATVN